MKNPKWHRDELILALDLYFQPNRGSIDARNPNIVALSQELNQLPIFSFRPDAERFRNPNGVSLKMSNFLSIDPNYSGKGMERHSKLDEIIFHEFANNRKRLHTIAARIRDILHDNPLREKLQQMENEVSVSDVAVHEGEVLYRLHKYRERNAELVAAKKRNVMKVTGALVCEVCDFDFAKTYGSLGQGFIECHHIHPLAEYEVSALTQLTDLAIVCSNCHRMLHRQPGIMTIQQLRELIVNQTH